MFVRSIFDTNPKWEGKANQFVKTGTLSVKSQVVDIILLAFSTDPVARWMYPNSQQYLETFPNFIRLFGGKAFETGSAYYVDGFQAASLWLSPNVSPDDSALINLFETTVHCDIRDELFYIFEEIENFQPKEPHWYLPMIGTDPAKQGNGYGSMLLQHALFKCDRENMPAYLESSNPQNIPLYERFGFKVLGEIQAGSSPPLFPMRRESREKISAYDVESHKNN